MLRRSLGGAATVAAEARANRHHFCPTDNALYRDNGKENENYYSIFGLYRDDGKESGTFHIMIVYNIGL